MQTYRSSNSSASKANRASTPRGREAPISNPDVIRLFDYLENAFVDLEYDHSFRFTETYLASRNLDINRIVTWLRERHACCDCEVLGEFEFNWRN